jgi:hypothetical protein
MGKIGYLGIVNCGCRRQFASLGGVVVCSRDEVGVMKRHFI